MAKKKVAEKIEFTYEGTNRAGTKVKGEVFAMSDAMAKGELRKQGINPMKVRKKTATIIRRSGKNYTWGYCNFFPSNGNNDAGRCTTRTVFRNYWPGS